MTFLCMINRTQLDIIKLCNLEGFSSSVYPNTSCPSSTRPTHFIVFVGGIQVPIFTAITRVWICVLFGDLFIYLAVVSFDFIYFVKHCIRIRILHLKQHVQSTGYLYMFSTCICILIYILNYLCSLRPVGYW